MKPFIDKNTLQESEFPENFVPKEAVSFSSYDAGEGDSSVAVKGFYLNGVIHVQEIVEADKTVEHQKRT